MTYQACIFDLDGVITDTAHYHHMAWRQLAKSVDVDFTTADNHQLKGVGRMESLEYILAKASRGYSDDEKAALAQQKNQHYKLLINNVSPDDTLPGIRQSLDWLRASGWKVGLASSSHNALQVISSLGLSNVFDYVANAASIPRGKPAPDIFLDVAAAFNIEPSNCIGVEDASAGVSAIKSANMFAIGIGDRQILAEADIVMPTPEDLTAYLRSIS